MNFEDTITIRLAGETTRAALFDDEALAQIAAAVYNTDSLPIQGPYQPLFDSLELGVSLPRVAAIDGAWQATGGSERRDVRLALSGFGDNHAIRIDALWRGGIVARTVPAAGRIVDVGTTRLDLNGLDDDIVPLPADPADLEIARRERVVARLRALFDAPDAADDDLVDRWLAAAHVSSVGDLLAGTGRTVHAEAVQVTFSPPEGGPPIPTTLPLTAALMARDTGFSVTALLADSKAAREQMLTLGLSPPRDATLPRRNDAVPVWIVPVSVFDDDGWPGGAQGMNQAQRRAARRQAAGQWLAREGIGLVVVS